MRCIILIMIVISSFSIISAQEKIDTVYIEKSYSNDFLDYSKFLREETKVHRESIESFYEKITYGLGLLISLFGGILIWLNWRTKKDIKEQVDEYYKKEIEKIFLSKIKQFENDIEEYQKKLEYQFKEINKLILDLSRQRVYRRKSREYSPPPVFKNSTILWVDDNPENNTYPIKILEEQGVVINYALNTRAALEKIGSNKYDVIISDMVRGEDDIAGLTLLKEIKNRQINIPVIIYASAEAVKKYRDSADELGAVNILYNTSSLLNEIQNNLG